jgi:BlaI family penicillinase repressor
MARKSSATLTDGELQLMRVLWNAGRATVSQVVKTLADDPAPAYNSVLTRLRILEKKGHAGHEKVGRAFRYFPRIDQRQARQHAISRLVKQLFDGSPSLLALNLLEQSQLDPAEVGRLRTLLEDDR